MRWRFADRIDAFEPWTLIRGRKGISLEEYSLLERFGRPGVFPETLILETGIHFARWLVAASSEWRESCLLTEITEFVYESEARMGDNLRIAVNVMERNENAARVACEVSAEGRSIARGELGLELIGMDIIQASEAIQIMWRELAGR